MNPFRIIRKRVSNTEIGNSMAEQVFERKTLAGKSVFISYEELRDLLIASAELARKYPGGK